VSMVRVRKNDVVIVAGGEETGKTGKVLFVDRGRGRVLVEGLNLVKKALRKSQDRPQGGIVEKEAPLAVSQVMPYCPQCKRGVRISRVTDGDRRVRKCRRCGHAFEA
jgi:large subunit ribosomal protein L24